MIDKNIIHRIREAASRGRNARAADDLVRAREEQQRLDDARAEAITVKRIQREETMRWIEDWLPDAVERHVREHGGTETIKFDVFLQYLKHQDDELLVECLRAVGLEVLQKEYEYMDSHPETGVDTGLVRGADWYLVL